MKAELPKTEEERVSLMDKIHKALDEKVYFSQTMYQVVGEASVANGRNGGRKLEMTTFGTFGDNGDGKPSAKAEVKSGKENKWLVKVTRCYKYELVDSETIKERT